MEQEQKPQQRSFVRELVPDWRLTRKEVLSATRITVVVIAGVLGVFVLLYVIGRLFGIELMSLLRVLAVPITVGAAVPLLNWLQKKRELDVEHQRAQDEALQVYLDQIGQLLLDKDRPLRRQSKQGAEVLLDKDAPLRQSKTEVQSFARANTLTVLSRLDGVRKARVLRFLYESDLINRSRCVIELRAADLSGVDLSETNLFSVHFARAIRGERERLRPRYVPRTKQEIARKGYITQADVTNLTKVKMRGADLSGANLSYTYLVGANLTRAELQEATLRGANLRGANLSEAGLHKADLIGSDPIGADLSGADLSEANLRGASLHETYLRGANLTGADLREADLSMADLDWAEGISADDLSRRAKSLEGATMPNGQKYEDWLKDRERREEDGENE